MPLKTTSKLCFQGMSKMKSNPEFDVFKKYKDPVKSKYFIKVASFLRVNPLNIRGFSYQCALRYNMKFPESWHINKVSRKCRCRFRGMNCESN